MTPDQERWAAVIAVHRMYGEEAAEHVAERIGGLRRTTRHRSVDGNSATARSLVERRSTVTG